MPVLAIDPGPAQSAFVYWVDGEVKASEIVENGEMLRLLVREADCDLVLEQVASYGMAVGFEVFETVFWTGRFFQRWESFWGRCAYRMPRMDVKMHLCHSSRAKDANIRQALIDRFGGKEAAIGCKAKKGPLYGIKADQWAALALAITWDETGKSGCKGVEP